MVLLRGLVINSIDWKGQQTRIRGCGPSIFHLASLELNTEPMWAILSDSYYLVY